MTRKPHTPKTRKPATQPIDNVASETVGKPVFAQPQRTDDPDRFSIKHPSDARVYKEIDELNREHKLLPLPFPAPRGLPEPKLTLAQVLKDPQADQKILKAGQIVFHALGDSGNVRGPESQNLVADKLVSDFEEQEEKDRPQFFFHLGDVIYNFGEAQYYYDQFYEPYRNYPAPILAIAGNHDGMVAPGANVETLAAFLDNFCAEDFVVTPSAGGLSRTAQIQPGVFFTFEAPFLRIVALYSNTLEDPGVIADDTIGSSQLDYLSLALTRVKKEGYKGALIIAHHHPAYTAGSQHGWSVDLLAQVDKICAATGVWPHAVLSGHAHNYQRFTRNHAQGQIPYVISGNGGHAIMKLTRRDAQPLRTPAVIQAVGNGLDQVVLENYDDQDYGYLRVIANEAQLRIEYHPASDGPNAKTPDDAVTIDLATRKLTQFVG